MNPCRTVETQLHDGRVIRAEIYRPRQLGRGDAWACPVRCSALFAEEKSIAGATADQALELATRFVRQLVGHKGAGDGAVVVRDVGRDGTP